jgi:putative oxygen-independent coproporphyrinogen III oxidase
LGGRRGARPLSLAPVGLYLHVPFCVSLCPYCDFVVYTGRATRGPQARLEPYLRAIQVELELRAEESDARFATTWPSGTGIRSARAPLTSVYLGGGTPSLLPAAEIGALLERVERRFGLAAGAEVTIEANPGPDERGDLVGFRAAGVTRISFGAQSLDAGELRRLGRRHRPDDVLVAVEAARRAGIEHRSVDLLYDIPGQTMATFQDSVERILEAPIDHLSAYALTLDDPDAAALSGLNGDHLPVRTGARRWRKAASAEQDDDRAADQYLWLDDRLGAAGLSWYEVSNWARPGAESRHNLAYWQRLPTLGVGPGAHAFDGGRLRSWNAARLEGYLASLLPDRGSARGDVARPRLPPGGVDVLDDAAIRLETVALALRTRAGISTDRLPSSAAADVDRALEAGLLERAPSTHLRLTARGRLLAGEVAVRLAA